MTADELKNLAVTALEDIKAVDIMTFDVRGVTAITDIMVIASGTSDQHVRALANTVLRAAKDACVRPLGTEGERDGEWILIDLNDIVVHLMQRRARDFYNLEKLWSVDAPPTQHHAGGDSFSV